MNYDEAVSPGFTMNLRNLIDDTHLFCAFRVYPSFQKTSSMIQQMFLNCPVSNM